MFDTSDYSNVVVVVVLLMLHKSTDTVRDSRRLL